MRPRIKIRGIYSTALTRFALDSGFVVVAPLPRVQARFAETFPEGPWDVAVQDTCDFQGIELAGDADSLCNVLTAMLEKLQDPIISDFLPTEDDDPTAKATLQLPGAAKAKLDLLRGAVVPTLHNHHRLKIINSELLRAAESELVRHPDEKPELEAMLFNEAILGPLKREGEFRLEHVRASGKPMRPRKGRMHKSSEDRIVFKRTFGQGRYDGLNLPIRSGDYGLTELREGDWYVRHSYFSRESLLIGDYFNINTPVELYPYGARYVDLEIDVVRRCGEEAFLTDREKLELLCRKGSISKDLHAKALIVAEQILRSLNRERTDKPETR
ncbi:MAG: DUF402 domain-containing protein [Desulfobacteraceae bacterium]|nr:DUF402 domain-containing protein [Desulfobacteraceae bacterium]